MLWILFSMIQEMLHHNIYLHVFLLKTYALFEVLESNDERQIC